MTADSMHSRAPSVPALPPASRSLWRSTGQGLRPSSQDPDLPEVLDDLTLPAGAYVGASLIVSFYLFPFQLTRLQPLVSQRTLRRRISLKGPLMPLPEPLWCRRLHLAPWRHRPPARRML